MLKIKSLREAAGMSQSEFAEASGVPVRHIRNFEQGTRSIDGAKIITLAKMADVLGCSISDMLEDDDVIAALKNVKL